MAATEVVSVSLGTRPTAATRESQCSLRYAAYGRYSGQAVVRKTGMLPGKRLAVCVDATLLDRAVDAQSSEFFQVEVGDDHVRPSQCGGGTCYEISFGAQHKCAAAELAHFPRTVDHIADRVADQCVGTRIHGAWPQIGPLVPGPVERVQPEGADRVPVGCRITSAPRWAVARDDPGWRPS